jgi:hypothetical protein
MVTDRTSGAMTIAGLVPLVAGALARVDQEYLEARQMQALSFAVHIPLVCFRIALPTLVLLVGWMHLRTGDPVYRQLAKRWSKAMLAINVSARVVIGRNEFRAVTQNLQLGGRLTKEGDPLATRALRFLVPPDALADGKAFQTDAYSSSTRTHSALARRRCRCPAPRWTTPISRP